MKDLEKKYTTIEDGVQVSKFRGTLNGKKINIKIYDYGFGSMERYLVEARELYTYRRVEGTKRRTLSEALNTVYWEGLE